MNLSITQPFGTIAYQNANSVAITGGSINGTTIGDTTVSTGKFSAIGVGSSSPSDIVSLNMTNSFSSAGEGSSRGISNTINASGTLTAGRNHYGSYSYINDGCDNAAFALSVWGSYSRADFSHSSTANSVYGLQALVENTGGGTITTAYGVLADINNTSGTITTAYGVFVGVIPGGTTYGVYQSGASNDNYFAGKVGIGVSTPTYALSFSGNAVKQIWMERHTTANTAGNNLTIQAGSATSGATDKGGGDIILKGGISTGTGTSGVQIQGCVAGASGTADGTFSTMIQVDSNKIGFFGVTPAVRPTAYTQTYSSASKTITQTTMTNPATYGAGTNGYSTAAQASAIHAEVIALRANMIVTQDVLNQVIDDLQALGILQ